MNLMKQMLCCLVPVVPDYRCVKVSYNKETRNCRWRNSQQLVAILSGQVANERSRSSLAKYICTNAVESHTLQEMAAIDESQIDAEYLEDFRVFKHKLRLSQ